MIRTMVQFDDEQWVAARDQARLEGLSLAAFVRRAVDDRLARAESARGAIVRRALAAIDRLAELGPLPGAHGEDGGRGADPGTPRYWLDYPLDDPAGDAHSESLDPAGDAHSESLDDSSDDGWR